MHLKSLSLAAGLFLASAAAAVASPAAVTNNINLRSGPGAKFAAVGSVPAGAIVNVLSCNGAWCRVAFGDRQGFVNNTYLAQADEGPVYGDAPPVVYAGPVYGYGYGYGYGWGPGWGWGGGWRGGGWRGGGHRR
jgi:uncharacterized protein YraI